MIKFIKKILGIGGKSRKPKPPKDYTPKARARVQKVPVNVRDYNGKTVAETKIAEQDGGKAEKQHVDKRHHTPVKTRVGASPRVQRKVAIPKKGSDLNHLVSLSLKEAFKGVKRRITLDGREVVVDIPRGAASGSVIRVNGAGYNGINGGSRGDLVVTIHVIEDEIFERKGDDLYCKLRIVVRPGDTVEVPTLVGNKIVGIPETIRFDKWVRYVGNGMPIIESFDAFGDLYYEFVEVSLDLLGSYLTKEGYENLRAEEKRLEQRLAELSKATGEAQPRESKVKKNAEFHDLQEKQSRVIARMQQIHGVLQSAQVVTQSELISNYVIFGSTVVLREEGYDELEEYQIVGAAESNPRQGKISVKSPMGSAVIGKKKGSKVKVLAPDGTTEFTIVDVKLNQSI